MCCTALHQMCNSFWDQSLLTPSICPILVLVKVVKWDFWEEESDDLFLVGGFFVTPQFLVSFRTWQGAARLVEAMLHCSPILLNSHGLTQAHKAHSLIHELSRLDQVKILQLKRQCGVVSKFLTSSTKVPSLKCENISRIFWAWNSFLHHCSSGSISNFATGFQKFLFSLI